MGAPGSAGARRQDRTRSARSQHHPTHLLRALALVSAARARPHGSVVLAARAAEIRLRRLEIMRPAQRREIERDARPLASARLRLDDAHAIEHVLAASLA